MLSKEDVEVLRFIDSKVVVYIHEVADAVWPREPTRNLLAGTRIKSLESSGYVVYRGQKKGYVVSTPKCEEFLKAEDDKRRKMENAAVKPLFDEEEPVDA